MRKPSIYSSNYYRIRRRRKIIARTLIVLTVFVVAFLIYNKEAVSYLKKLSSSIKLPEISQAEQKNQGSAAKSEENKNEGKAGKNKETSAKLEKSQLAVNLQGGGTISILVEKKANDTEITGIKGGTNVFSTVRSDGKAIVFDWPSASDIYIYMLNGGLKKLNPDNYKEYKKESIMKEYSDYIWAAKPYFLQDGRIVYQSNLPWFKIKNSIYLWVVNQDGSYNHKIASTGQGSTVTYNGFDGSGELLIEYGGSEHTVALK